MKKLLVFVFCLLVWRTNCLNNIDSEVEAQCIQNCPFQNRTDNGHYGYACDHNCNSDQCTSGCRLWKKALSNSCQEACNGTTDRLISKELYCIMGCNDAITKYFSKLRTYLGVPPPPALLADSLNADSLKLEWNFPKAKMSGLSCHVQWRYEEFSTTWQYCRNASWNQENTVFYIYDLQPYTKYRFRIALILGSAGGHPYGEPIVSTESVVISTLASGVPLSPPQNVRVTPVDSSSISISWEPGPFPHGPLLSYVLNITDNRHSEVKDIPPENSFVMVRDVKPSRNYTIEIKMRNKRGPGPAAIVSVLTPAERQMNNVLQPPLILGTNCSIFELNNILGEPNILYRSEVELKGIAYHFKKKLFFVTDSDGFVSRLSLAPGGFTKTRILEPQNLDFKPLDITVDWLNNQLYILGEVKFQISKYIIKRCNFDGSGVTVSYAGLTKKPSSLEIDPLNGYLFWTIQDYNKGGLFRLDINDISNGIKHEVKINKILNETELGAFTFEYHNFNILISYQRLNTIMSVTLDGKEVKNIRTSVTTPKLKKVVSLAMASKKFYWTDGVDVFNEEYHAASRSYFHNTIPQQTSEYYKKVFINLQSSQPWPTPINPPTNVQAIFGRNIAKTRWQPPHLVGLQGKGAWQNWSYEISLKEINSEEIIIHKNINDTFFTITNLKENTEYILRVAAYTNSGRGPWSSGFKGTTLNASKTPILIWSATDGLLQSNAAGENVEVLIDKSEMKDLHFVDIAGYKDRIFLVANTSQVYWYNFSTRAHGRLAKLDSVGSIAVDWIGMKLYWSNPKQQMIIRSSLDGTDQEPLLTVLAKELNIDSVKAYLYWTTGIKVECARLNGVERYEYHDVEYFSGKQVMGLTLNLEQKFVYWIVRGSDGSHLYKGPMKGYWDDKIPDIEKVSSLQKPDIQGPLCYFHKRLLWLQDGKNAAISDLAGKNIATVSGKQMQGLNLVHVVDSFLDTLPDDTDPWLQVNVLPEKVNNNSVEVVGSSDSFNVTWNPVKNVNYGQVFYEVQIDDSTRIDGFTIVTTTNSTVKYSRKVTPFTPLNVTIRAFTYWSSAPPVRSKIFSPPSTPSAPRNPRSFVEYLPHSSTYPRYATITIRWDPPLYPNGVLHGFKLRCWYVDEEDENICDNAFTRGNETEYKLEVMESDSLYHFEVRAFTKIGLGASSPPLSVDTAVEHPVPTILASNHNSIYIYDVDYKREYLLVDGITEPRGVAYLMKEKKVFWINTKREIYTFDVTTMVPSKIAETTSDARGLTINWLERSLYYLQDVTQNTTEVYKVDLNLELGKSVKILEADARITEIDVSPFSKSLFWIQTKDNLDFSAMLSDETGSNIRQFSTNSNSPSCNCPSMAEFGPTFCVDSSNRTLRPKVVFYERQFRSILRADGSFCDCEEIAGGDTLNGAVDGFPSEHLRADFGTIYWTEQKSFHALEWRSRVLLTEQIEMSNFIIYGQHMQPFPQDNCLSPKQQQNLTVSLKARTSNSLILLMPKPSIDEECSNISMATIAYTIYYSIYDEGFDCFDSHNCTVLITTNTTQEITNLKPFSNYLISVSASNYFTMRDSITIGPSTMFQTAPGVPSKPRNVSAIVLSPNLARVVWSPPEELNAAVVHYEVHWQTETTPSGVRQKGELRVNDSETLTTFLTKLTPNETYTVWVRVYSENNDTPNDSDRVKITTYPEPPILKLVKKTAYNLEISWEPIEYIEKYVVVYAPITTEDWREIEKMKEANKSVVMVVENLKPSMTYKFRMKLLYEGNEEMYVWPGDARFTFETLGDVPSPPGMPLIQYITPNIYKVIWEASRDNGAPVEMYKLEGKILRFYRTKRSTNRTVPFYNTSPSVELEDPDEWRVFYNGTNTSWIISGLDEKHKYAFRVSAYNSYGWSNTSEESNEFDPMAARMAEKQNPMKLILIATLVPISICVIFILVFVFLSCSGKRNKKKKLQQVIPTLPRMSDVELATLRELPRRGIHNTNILYASIQPTLEELSLLPQIRRDQITLTKFLGSGAFGEVFEGKSKGIDNSNAETKVAVKTLKKGASEQEKSDFLQEAQLMSHFKHEHILQLLGVCLDNDPHFIIMELMEGGDLLTYLRESRNPLTQTPSLTLIELLKMCVDVSKGCRYLEEMHFVHRDLACRNCLVSSCDADSRIVKIGDFGLARDIYKNDYYRKEGEGLLPVRWMAPESLVDGVFTSQSDVWAFGVLLWEIMTLGQQPYPARANLEVLHYVRRGGRLGKPTDCPEELHELMLKCWEFEPESRPTFKYCFEVLEELHRRTLRNPTTGAHEGQYISTVPDRNSWKSDNEDDATKEKTPFLKEENSPAEEVSTYLELINDPEPVLENDGYEVPNQMMKKVEANGGLFQNGEEKGIVPVGGNKN
ncbi:receptor protein-tyrosine kinase sevenless isoform X2 [Leptinotarsa decemlineata]|uniref:receptor protein-tyrosine kinase sevenless isoform X2 n=1 Tax=Leptinotarsa decemlineata TaxID=7539 RepID=UPI003D306EA1